MIKYRTNIRITRDIDVDWVKARGSFVSTRNYPLR